MFKRFAVKAAHSQRPEHARMAANGLKRTRSPSAPRLEAPVQGSSKDLEGGRSRDTSGAEDTDGWTTVGTPAKKKPKKLKAKKLEMAVPLFQFDPSGFKHRQVHVTDIRDLVLNILDKASHPKWLKISNKAAIRGVCLLLVQGMDPTTLGLPSETTNNLPQTLNPGPNSKSRLPVFQQLFSHYCPTRAPGDLRKLHSVSQTLLNVTLPANEKARRDQERTKLAAQAGESNDPSLYLLPAEDFPEQGYILPTYSFDIATRQVGGKQGKKKAEPGDIPPFEDWLRKDGFIETPRGPDVVEGENSLLLSIIGVDCEMCITTAGSEVCRVSLVDGDGALIYNSLVKPKNAIVDYATQYSGITKELLDPVTVTLEDVQRRLIQLIDYNTVLVGHSLNCDLAVLKLVHPWIVDTSVIFHHTRGPPFKASLKWLASKWLQKEIQKPHTAGGLGTLGHDSEEDARAAVQLLRLKMANGPSFGEFVADQESIFERLSRATPPKTTAVVDHGNPGQWHGAKATTAHGCRSDDEIAGHVSGSVDKHDLVYGRFIDLSHALEWSQASRSGQGKTAEQKVQANAGSNGLTDSSAGIQAENTPAPKAGNVEAAYKRLNQHIEKIYEGLPTNTAFIIVSGHGDPRAVTALTSKKHRFDQLFKTMPLSTMPEETKWKEEDDRALLAGVHRLRDGMTFLAMKH